MPAVTATMLAPIIRLEEPNFRMEANPFPYGKKPWSFPSSLDAAA
jgi:hypothetical protein